jgi:hypothetical protein
MKDYFVGFEVFTAVTMKNSVAWDVVLCTSCVNRRIGGTITSTYGVEKSANEEPA